MKTETRWIADHHFEGEHEGNVFSMDGEKKVGPSPKALLLTGLAGCSGIDVVDILEKMKVPFSDFTITAETEQTEDHPKVFKEITVVYTLKSERSNEVKIRKAIDLSLEKYCGVAAMLKKNSPISYRLVIQ